MTISSTQSESLHWPLCEIAVAAGVEAVDLFAEDSSAHWTTVTSQGLARRAEHWRGMSARLIDRDATTQFSMRADGELALQAVLEACARKAGRALGCGCKLDDLALSTASLPDAQPIEAELERLHAMIVAAAPNGARISLIHHVAAQAVAAGSSAVDDGCGRIELRRRWGLALDVELEHGGQSVWIERSIGGGGEPDETDAARLLAALELPSDWTHAVDRRRPPLGRRSLVFAPLAAAMLAHEAIGHALEHGPDGAPSWLERGAACGPTTLHVRDDPSLPGRFGSRLVDDRGRVSHALTLVAEGRVRAPLDRAHSACARREDFRHPLASRMSNTIVERGRELESTLIAACCEGALIERVAEGHFDRGNGRVVLTVLEATEIRAGRLGARLLPFVLEADVAALLAGVEVLGAEPRVLSSLCVGPSGLVPVSSEAPAMLVRGLVARAMTAAEWRELGRPQPHHAGTEAR